MNSIVACIALFVGCALTPLVGIPLAIIAYVFIDEN